MKMAFPIEILGFSGNDAMILLAAGTFTLLIFAAMIILVLRESLPFLPYIAADTIVSARASFLIKGKRMEDMIGRKSVPEFVNALQNTEYFEHIAQSKSIVELHSGIEKAFMKSITEIEDMSPDKFKPVIQAYISIYETKIIKAFYRSRMYRSLAELNDNMLFYVGEITPFLLQELKNSKTTSDVSAALSRTKYAPVFSKDFSTVNDFEAEIDSFVFSEFARQVKKLKGGLTMPVLKILNSKFDIMNILLILKFQSRKIPAEKRQGYLIKNNSPAYHIIEGAAQSSSPGELYEFINHTAYAPAFLKALEMYKADGSYSHFEYQLLKYHYRWVEDLELFYPQGPFTIIAYLSRKEAEMSNLLLLSKAMFFDIPEQNLREMIV